MAKPEPQKNTIIKTLESLGLNKNEATLYSLMLRHPQSTVRELEVQAPFSRTMLYHVLGQLTERGLISQYRKRARTTYTTESPEKLYEILASKEQEFEQDVNAVRALIPKLKNCYRLSGNRPSVRIFEGIEEYKKALEDIIISKPTKIYTYEILGKKKPALEVCNMHNKRRIAKKIQKNVLFFSDVKALGALANYKYNDYTKFKSIKDEKLAPFDTDVILYDGKLLYTSYADTNEPVAVLMEDKALYTMQKSLFDMLWQDAEDRTLYFTEINKNN